LFKNKETWCHTLSSWDSVAFWWRSTYHLEEVLSNS
jgi:hypothetical protein